MAETPKSKALEVIEDPDGGFHVVHSVAGPFETNAAAWKWIDDHTDEGRDDADRYNRIRIAFSGR
jgi:hypothetical protein